MAKRKKDKDAEKERRIPKPQLDLSAETKRGIMVVVFIVLALVCLLSIAGLAGSLGFQMFRIMTLTFGVMAYAVPLIFLSVAISLYKEDLQKEGRGSAFYWRVYFGAIILAGSIAGLVHMFYINSNATAFDLAADGKGGGYLGALFAVQLYKFFGFWAGCLILIALMIIALLVTFDVSLREFFAKSELEQQEEDKQDLEAKQPAILPPLKINSMGKEGFVSEKVLVKNPKIQDDEPLVDSNLKSKPQVATATKIVTSQKPAGPQIEAIVLEDRKDWKLPGFDLLDDNQAEVDSGNIEVNVAIIKKTLSDFGINVEMGEVNVGPSVTQYTLAPAAGIKLSRIAELQNNLALALAAQSIRMELPIPGKALIGIEVPNKSTAMVRLRGVIQTNEFIHNKSKLVFALGRDVGGVPIIADLAKMPHLLVAGTTGSGKSVGVNSLIISFLYRNTPQDVKFIIVDPKRVEMTLYNGIPHLLTPVITESEKAVNALKWAVAEMDRRYKLLSEAGKRNIIEYNEAGGLTLPYIVIVVDELADLMATSQADVEGAIVRLAQMARAIGIHLVLATQRPSVDIITGLIKANISSRISFKLPSLMDSRTILDAAGAEKLLGNGDMLFATSEAPKPKRIQGAFLSTQEVKKVVDFFKSQVGAVIYNEEILEKPKRALGIPGMEGDNDGGDDDPLLEEATAEVKRSGKASASLLQRRLRVGYARAARLLDILEAKGIIGPGEGAKPREVYGVVPPDEKAEYGIEDTE